MRANTPQAASVTLTALPGIPLVRPGDDLVSLIGDALERGAVRLQPDDILVIAQKVVSKAQGRYVRLRDVVPSERALALAETVGKDARLVELILRESREVLRQRRDVLVVEHRLGFVMANAGIDASNVEQESDQDTVLLLPEDPDATCERLRQALMAQAGGNLGVIINDSHGRAWRNGTVGVAIGAAGLPSLWDRRGDHDLFGRPLLITEIGLADEAAAAASLLMGPASEGMPVVLLRGLRFPAVSRNAGALVRPRDMDLFR